MGGTANNQRYATGKYSIAICDRCGIQYPYMSLITEVDTQEQVCAGCVDEPDPYRRRLYRVDAVALEKPRPDTNLAIDYSSEEENPIVPITPGTAQ